MGPRDVARATGVSTDTLRHYERKGLLPRAPRTPGGYRQYPAATVDRVLLIQRALVVGFSLDELKRILALRDRGGAPCQTVRALLDERMTALDQRIQELLGLRDELRHLAKQWDGRLAGTPAGARAHLLDTLSGSVVVERTRRQRKRPALAEASKAAADTRKDGLNLLDPDDRDMDTGSAFHP